MRWVAPVCDRRIHPGDSLGFVGGQSTSETLERLAPGTPMRRALERVIQQGKGGLVVLGHSSLVDDASSGRGVGARREENEAEERT